MRPRVGLPLISKGRPLAFDDRELQGVDRFSAAPAPSASLKPPDPRLAFVYH
jgi:hypothetical protein